MKKFHRKDFPFSFLEHSQAKTISSHMQHLPCTHSNGLKRGAYNQLKKDKCFNPDDDTQNNKLSHITANRNLKRMEAILLATNKHTLLLHHLLHLSHVYTEKKHRWTRAFAYRKSYWEKEKKGSNSDTAKDVKHDFREYGKSIRNENEKW